MRCLILIALCLTGCGGVTSREQRMLTEITDLQIALQKAEAEAKALGDAFEKENAGWRVQVEGLKKRLNGGVHNRFTTNVRDCEKHLSEIANGGFRFERSPKNPAMSQGKHARDHGSVTLFEDGAGRVESASVTLYLDDSLTPEMIAQRSRIVDDMLACVDPKIPAEEVRKLMIAQLGHANDDISVVRSWHGIEGKAFYAPTFGMLSVTFKNGRD